MLPESFPSVPKRNKEIIAAEAAKLFLQIRDVPYALGLDGDPNKLLVDHRGNCSRKHLYLMPRLQALGYKVTLGIAEFDWRNLPIPAPILGLLRDPVDTHLFLYTTLDRNEMIVDATWDSGMPLGFLINDWRGTDSTQVSVPTLRVGRENYHLLHSRATLLKALSYLRPVAHRPTPFNDAFNHWLNRRIT